MWNCLYLLRSVVRRPKRHITLFVLLTCAFLLPLFISFFRDSIAYGRQQYLISESKEQAFHICNASIEDLSFFSGIHGLTEPIFSENTIYLSILSDEDWKNNEAATYYANEIVKRIDLVKDKPWILVGYDYYYAHGVLTDPTDISIQRTLLLVNLFVVSVAIFVMQSAYKSHLLKFASEVGVLRSLGASYRQVRTMFILEFMFLFPLSSICAFLISWGITSVLFANFLEVSTKNGLAWLIFHVNPMNTLIHFIIFFIFLIAIMLYTLTRMEKKSLWTMVHGVQRISEKNNNTLHVYKSPIRSMAKLWTQRTGQSLYGCLAVSVPIMTIFLFLCGYLVMNINVASTSPEHDLTITTRYDETRGFSEADVEFVESLEGVSEVEWHKHPLSTHYHIRVSAEDEHVYDERSVLLLKFSDINSQFEGQLSKYDVIVCSSQKRTSYKSGDTIMLSEIVNDQIVSASIVLTVVGTVNVSETFWATDIYLSDELYALLTEEAPISECEIKLTDPNQCDNILTSLRSHFASAEYEIEEFQSAVKYMEGAAKGVYILLYYLFCVLVAFVLTIVSTKLNDYINSSQRHIHVLYIIGAPKASICSSYMVQTSFFAIIAILLPILGPV